MAEAKKAAQTPSIVRNEPTIWDVAKAAGVSIAAVSQALNAKGRIASRTRRNILAVARQLRYHPNRHARNLAARASRTLGIVVSDIENPFFSVLIRSFEAQARSSRYDVIVSETNYDLELMERAAERLIEQKLRGVAIMTSEMSVSWLEEIIRRDIPVVCFDLDFPGSRASNIQVDYVAGMRQAIGHLHNFGHRRIAFVGGQLQLNNILWRQDSYSRAMREQGLEIGPILTGNQRLDGGYEAGQSIMKMASRPTAVIAVNDLTAIGLINAFFERGLRVPEDISVSGFDNTYLSSYFIPRLTTVDMHPALLGRTAAEALHEASSSSNTRGKQYPIAIDLVIGKSTGPAPNA
ncbi:MAG: LacI family DNA-binding transcriptional regulator [Terriglobia bacterium]